jgi:hypothetical protein
MAIHLLYNISEGPAYTYETFIKEPTYKTEFSDTQAEVYLFFVLGLINSLN